jgi:hypothetical protein
MLLRFLLILGIVVYVIYKIASFFFKAGAASQQLRNQQKGPGVNAGQSGKNGTKASHFKGGEYVDYEDVSK